MTAGQEKAIEIFATHLRPRERRLVGGILDHRCVVPPRVRVGPHQPADGGDVLEAGQEAPEIQTFAGKHHVVGLPGRPSGVANVTEWPSRLSTLQLTAASVGSKSRLGIGMRTLATFNLRLARERTARGLAPALLLRHMKER